MKLFNLDANASGGVIEQGSDTPVSTEETSPASETQGENENIDVGTQELPQKKKGDPRYQKLANENREYRRQLEEFNQHKDAIEFNKWVRSNPKAASAIQAVSLAILNNKDPVQALSQLVGAELENNNNKQDPYADYDPEVAEKFRRLDAIEKRLQEEDRQRKESEARSLEENRSHLDELYEKKLREDGFIAKDGSFNQDEIDLISDAVLARASRIAKNPERITEAEMIKAYEQVIKGAQLFEKRGLKRTVQVAPPPTPSNRGVVPIGKTKETEEQRIERITREFISSRGA